MCTKTNLRLRNSFFRSVISYTYKSYDMGYPKYYVSAEHYVWDAARNIMIELLEKNGSFHNHIKYLHDYNVFLQIKRTRPGFIKDIVNSI